MIYCLFDLEKKNQVNVGSRTEPWRGSCQLVNFNLLLVWAAAGSVRRDGGRVIHAHFPSMPTATKMMKKGPKKSANVKKEKASTLVKVTHVNSN